MKLVAYTKTLAANTDAQRLSATDRYIPAGFAIAVDSGTVMIGDSDVGTNGFKLPTTPMKMGDFMSVGKSDTVNLYDVWVKGGSGSEVVRVLYFKESDIT